MFLVLLLKLKTWHLVIVLLYIKLLFYILLLSVLLFNRRFNHIIILFKDPLIVIVRALNSVDFSKTNPINLLYLI